MHAMLQEAIDRAQPTQIPNFAGLEFHVLDAVNDPLPDGDVVLLRQVLQHLSNDSVATVVSKIRKYATAIISENVPCFPFKPNIDMPTGADDRTKKMSGLILTEAPLQSGYKDHQSDMRGEVAWGPYSDTYP